MAKRSSVKIDVPKPCSEDWEKMTANERGRHCSNCNKTVIDFSLFTDKELAAFLKHTPHGCGRFDPHQLNRPIIFPTENSNTFLQRALLGTALVAGIATSTQGQVNQQNTLPAKTSVSITPGSETNKNTEPKTATQHTIQGVVLSSVDSETMRDIYVIMKGVDTVLTDSVGRFSITVPDRLKGMKIKLKIEDYYYHPVTIHIAAGSYPTDLKIRLKRNNKRMLMGKF